MDDYARHLSEHPDEVGLLQKDLLIGVTEFFRQPQAWEILEKKVIAPLVESAPEGSEIRVWVPGCSTGKEVYSLAMLLAEQVEKTRQEDGLPDLRHRHRRCRAGDGPDRQLSGGRDRRERLGRAAQAVLFPQGRPLSGHQEPPRADRLRRPEPHRRSALLQAGPDQLPQSPDLPGPAGAEEDHRPVSLRPARRGISVSGQRRDRSETGRTSSSRFRRNGGSIAASASASRECRDPGPPRRPNRRCGKAPGIGCASQDEPDFDGPAGAPGSLCPGLRDDRPQAPGALRARARSRTT